MLYNGETENVRSSLNGYMEPEQLEKFLNSIQKLRQNAPQAEHRKGFVSHHHTFLFFAIDNTILRFFFLERNIRNDFRFKNNNK